MFTLIESMVGFLFSHPLIFYFFANTLISRKLNIKAFTNHKL